MASIIGLIVERSAQMESCQCYILYLADILNLSIS